jgi:hypothetical protein
VTDTAKRAIALCGKANLLNRACQADLCHDAGRPWSVAWRAGPADRRSQAFLARLVEDGPIPAVHGVVRWRACDLIMRLHEEFGLSVSDDTVTLKELGFSHVSARPKAYKQDSEAVEAFKKTFPPAWRKSARSLRLALR